jgi:hypothetical protein
MSLPSNTKDYNPVQSFCKKFRKNYLNFNSENLAQAENYYVSWIDLMGAGHTMSTSVQKSANLLARLHMAVEYTRASSNFSGYLLPINDGVFIVSKRKREILSIVGGTIISLAANFIATPRPHDRFFLRGAIAYGPVYFGSDLAAGLLPKVQRKSPKYLDRVMFGPALIQAFKSEAAAPPYGVSVHESARAFCPQNEGPFRMTHWMWWAPNEEVDYPSSLPSLTDLKDCLLIALKDQFQWLEWTSIYHGLRGDKLKQWSDSCEQYFRLG